MVGVRLLCLGLALLMDAVLGEPPTRLHPVAWMGKGIGLFQRLAPRQGRLIPFTAGCLFLTAGTGLAVGVGLVLDWYLPLLYLPVAIFLEALILKSMFSVRLLWSASNQVRAALQAGQLDEARRLTRWHLVSRDTAQLDEPRLIAAVIESVAENTSDSVVGPILWYALGGLPAVLAYRFINTADAMIGYRDPENLWLGKATARLDDVVNLLPARLTAVLLVGAGSLLGANPFRALHIWRRDWGKTSSPNAGHPMSAAAGVLGVELEKVGHYRLGEGQRLPTPDDIARAGRLLWVTTLLTLLILTPLTLLIEAWR